MRDGKEAKLSFFELMGLFFYGYKMTSMLTPTYIPLLLSRAFVTAVQPLLVLFFSARILNQLDGIRDQQTIILYVSITVGATFSLSAIKAFLVREAETISSWDRAYHKYQMVLAERFIKIDFAHAEDSKVNELLARMDTLSISSSQGLMNVYWLSPAVAEHFFSMLFALILLVGPFAAGVHISGWQLWLLYGFFICGILLILHLQARAQAILELRYSNKIRASTSKTYYSGYVKADQAAKDIRLYNQSPMLQSIFENCFDLKTWLPYFFYNGRVNGFMLGLLATFGGAFYLLAGYGALDGTVTLGAIVQSVGAITAFATAIGTLIMTLGQLFHNAAFIKPLQEYWSLPDLLAKGTKPVTQKDGNDYHIEFRGVSFRYPGSEKYALKDLNLKFNTGQRLAVVGLNGSGKTTMIKLLCRFYDPTEGEILLNGVNIKEYDYEQYTALFSAVFQDFHLFPFELGANVAAEANYDKSRVADCLDSGGFTKRLHSLPDGLDTMLYQSYDEDGVQISGGEAQKIALARALYKNAPFVILDEPTAALDPVAEYEIYSSFEQIIGGKTAVFISHRLSSCRFCHDIAVFDGGQLVQRGGHDTLLSDEDGLYSKLWDAQAQHYVDT